MKFRHPNCHRTYFVQRPTAYGTLAFNHNAYTYSYPTTLIVPYGSLFTLDPVKSYLSENYVFSQTLKVKPYTVKPLKPYSIRKE